MPTHPQRGRLRRDIEGVGSPGTYEATSPGLGPLSPLNAAVSRRHRLKWCIIIVIVCGIACVFTAPYNLNRRGSAGHGYGRGKGRGAKLKVSDDEHAGRTEAGQGKVKEHPGDTATNASQPQIGAKHNVVQSQSVIENVHISQTIQNTTNTSAVINQANRKTYAFVTVIGNRKYTEGGAVFAFTLRLRSPCVQRCRDESSTGLCCRIVAVAPPSVTQGAGAGLLKHVFDEIVEVEDLGVKVPGSVWQPSFNKLHMFSLHHYERVAYFDADCLVLHDPDGVFDVKLPDSMWVGAFGTDNDPYFSTGFMVVEPTRELYTNLMKQFTDGVESGKYRGTSARDGEVLRDFFGTRHKFLPRKYSDYKPVMRPLDEIIVYHFRGGFKPWFHPLHPPSYYIIFYEEFGLAYTLWWDLYDRLKSAAAGEGSEEDRKLLVQGAPSLDPNSNTIMLGTPHAWERGRGVGKLPEEGGEAKIEKKDGVELRVIVPGYTFNLHSVHESCQKELCLGCDLICEAATFSPSRKGSCNTALRGWCVANTTATCEKCQAWAATSRAMKAGGKGPGRKRFIMQFQGVHGTSPECDGPWKGSIDCTYFPPVE